MGSAIILSVQTRKRPYSIGRRRLGGFFEKVKCKGGKVEGDKSLDTKECLAAIRISTEKG